MQVVAPRVRQHVLQEHGLEAARQGDELHRVLGQLARALRVLVGGRVRAGVRVGVRVGVRAGVRVGLGLGLGLG